MKYPLFSAVGLSLVLAACSSNDNACEDITLASEQIQQCQALHRQIVNAKGKPIIRTELERRYQQDCIDIRYYRDEKKSPICGNKDRVEKIIEAAKQEAL
ncbi:MAG: hypothetical protein OQK09_12320 [Colwellia sp.]|nr:hypothetical protein [Colwellia sp.]